MLTIPETKVFCLVFFPYDQCHAFDFYGGPEGQVTTAKKKRKTFFPFYKLTYYLYSYCGYCISLAVKCVYCCIICVEPWHTVTLFCHYDL